MTLDPLRRVFVPIVDPLGNFRTTDGRQYVRLENGQCVRAWPKARGKAARRAAKQARRVLKAARAGV